MANRTCDDVARALVPAASALMPALACDTLSEPQTRVETSLDGPRGRPGTSARATSAGGVRAKRARPMVFYFPPR